MMKVKWKYVLASMMLAIGLVFSSPAMAAKAINVNTATVATLEKIKGIGPALAKRIVKYRKTHGAFKSLDGLTHVRGIGEKTLGHFRNSLTVGKKG